MSEENLKDNVTEGNYGTGNFQDVPPQGGKGMAIASMILGIVSIVTSCIWYLGIPCAIVGLILGILHNKKNEKSGMATAGIVCSIISLVLVILILVLAAIGFAALGASGINLNSLQ